MINAIYEKLLENSILYSDKIAVVDRNNHAYTYSQLKDMAYVAAYKLWIAKCKKQSKILLAAIPRVEFVAYYYGIHILGAICVPFSINANQTSFKEIKEILQTSLMVGVDDFEQLSELELTEEIKETVDNTLDKNRDIVEIADILFTSGTTGKQKGVQLTNLGINQAISNIREALSVTEKDIVAVPLPFFHSNALGTLRTYISVGGTVVMLDGLKDISRISQYFDIHNCTGLSCSPVMMEWIIRRYGNNCNQIFRNVRYIEIGTAPLLPGSRRKIREKIVGKQIFINYGSTETPRAVYMDIAQFPKDDAIGKTVGDYEIRLFDDDNNVIEKCNTVGRVGLNSKAMTVGYFEEAESNADAMIGDFFLTGDVAYIDKEGFIYLKGRTKDMIIVGGEKVYPAEIEDKINSIVGVVESACVGIHVNESIGQRIHAYVTTDSKVQISEQHIIKTLVHEIENYKIPDRFFLWIVFPEMQWEK